MTIRAQEWARIPEELKSLNQWCIAGKNKAPFSVKDGKLFSASVTEPSQWLSFVQAVKVAIDHSLEIGFVLTESDPYTCIDLDVKDSENAPENPELWTSQEQFDLFNRIVYEVKSYTELSRSGKGIHIWVKSKTAKGVRRDGVEIYSQERFIICTGKVILEAPIEDRNSIILKMRSQMMRTVDTCELEELPENEDDWSILKTATEASNHDKFIQLWKGEWKELGFPSQSEADLALMSMLTFYSPSNEQCRRIFRESALGKREKSVKNNRYLDLTLATIRAREAREKSVDISQIISSLETVKAIKQEAPKIEIEHTGLDWPPGFCGDIAKFIFQSSPRPVKEVSIVAALGLLAGICGKAWHIPQSGLNMYIILVAKSAIGKEAMHSGISALIKACTADLPAFYKFVSFDDYASGPALVKACAANPSFVNVSGEWGRKLKRLSRDDKDGPLATLRTQMTNLYQKSGPQAIVGGIGYSKQENNIASIAGVAYSMIGETTPGTFYESLTDSMMEDGFLSRFLIVEYDGVRPPMNNHQILEPDANLSSQLRGLAFRADVMIIDNISQPVLKTEEVANILNDFENECDYKINTSDNEAFRQMWNRAALKSYRLAALLAVADNCVNPIIETRHINWALSVVRKDISTMTKRMETGDVGIADDSRDKKLMSVIKTYTISKIHEKHKSTIAMQKDNIIPRSFLQQRVSKTSSFVNHKFDRNHALDLTLQNAINNGYIIEVDKKKLAELYNFYGKAYRILKLPDYYN